MPVCLTDGLAHNTRALVSGTWVAPSSTRPTLVQVKVVSGAIGGGDVLDYDVELRDENDVAVTGYPLSTVYSRGGLAAGSNDLEFAVTILVPTGYDYRVVDNSSGATGVSLNAVEDRL